MARDDGARTRRRHQELDDDFATEPEGKPHDEAPALEEVGRRRRGLPPLGWLGVVVVLVLGALLAGFLLGFAAGRAS